MKNKITFLGITIPANRPAYVNVMRNGKVTTLSRRLTPARMCLMASLAEKLLYNAGLLAFPVGKPGGGHISLSWFNKDWEEEARPE